MSIPQEVIEAMTTMKVSPAVVDAMAVRSRAKSPKTPPLSPMPVSADLAYPYEVELIGGPSRDAVWAQDVEPPERIVQAKVARIDVLEDGSLEERGVSVHRYVLLETVEMSEQRVRYRYQYVRSGR